MKRDTSIRLKAAFLLTVFALNTILGFACSVGVDMGFNSEHHKVKVNEETGLAVHIHKDGKRHVHGNKEESSSNNHSQRDQAITDLKKDGQKHLHSAREEKHSNDKSHHNDEAVVHIHKNGKRHVHRAKKQSLNHDKPHDSHGTGKAVVHIHKDGNHHIHANMEDSNSPHSKALDHPTEKVTKKEDNENCCTDEVRNFEQMDKSVPHTVKVVHPTFFTAFIDSYLHIDLLPRVDFVRNIKQFLRSYHPPISDVRIAIQSFQI